MLLEDVLSSAAVTAHPSARTFRAFMGTDAFRGRWGDDAEFCARLGAARITSLSELLRWAKERYPSHFSPDWRAVTGMPYSRERMKELWAGYLGWKEA